MRWCRGAGATLKSWVFSPCPIRSRITALSAFDADVIGFFARSNELSSHATDEDCRVGIRQLSNGLIETVLLQKEEAFFCRVADTADDAKKIQADCRLG